MSLRESKKYFDNVIISNGDKEIYINKANLEKLKNDMEYENNSRNLWDWDFTKSVKKQFGGGVSITNGNGDSIGLSEEQTSSVIRQIDDLAEKEQRRAEGYKIMRG